MKSYSKTKSESIRALTEGAIIVALTMLIALAARFFLAVDSLVYYFLPLPLAIYSARHDLKYSITAFAASLACTFIFVDPMYALLIFLPNLLIGVVFGVLDQKCSSRLINYATVFILCLAADFLSIYAYELITGLDYWADMDPIIEWFAGIFTNMSVHTIKNVFSCLIVVVLILDSLMKVVLLFLIFTLLVTRLKLIKDYKPKPTIKIIYSPVLAIIMLSLALLSGLFLGLYISSEALVFKIFFIIIFSLFTIVAIYGIYQVNIFLRFKFKKANMFVMVLLVILTMILAPITVIVAFVLNLIRWNFINEALK